MLIQSSNHSTNKVHMNNTTHEIFNKLIHLENTLSLEMRSLSKKYKITNLYQNIKKYTYIIIKTLSIVSIDYSICTMGRGLHFLRNWFKNKVPHHPAPRMWGLFFILLSIRVQPKVFFNKIIKSLKLILIIKMNFSLLTVTAVLGLFLKTTILVFTTN